MEDSYDNIPVLYRIERIGRIRDSAIQIDSDYALYEALKQKMQAANGNETDIEEMEKIATWLKKDYLTYRRLNSMSIEGITCGKALPHNIDVFLYPQNSRSHYGVGFHII